MSILDLMCTDGFITVNRHIASVLGLEAAVILGELASEHLYWTNRDPEFTGEFYSTVENLEARTFMTAHTQRLALNKLQEAGLIQVTKKGMPAKRYIRINEEAISKVVNDKSSKILTTGDKEFQPLVVKNFDGNNNISKNTKEKKINKDSKKHFTPPTVEEVAAYCAERGNNVDPEKFVAYYTAADWYRGKTKISNWKACVITWEKNNEKAAAPAGRIAADNPFTELLKQEGYV